MLSVKVDRIPILPIGDSDNQGPLGIVMLLPFTLKARSDLRKRMRLCSRVGHLNARVKRGQLENSLS